MSDSLTVRPLADAGLPAARVAHRRAFGAFLGIPPEDFRPGADCLGPRWRMWPEGGFAAWDGNTLVGSGLLVHWGSACILGPLTVDPDRWSGGVARALMTAMIAAVDEAGFQWTGLFTHPQSPKHIRLYEEYGFGMQRITAILSKAVSQGSGAPPPTFGTLSDAEKSACLMGIRALGETVAPGLDWRREVVSINAEDIGETVVLGDPARPGGFACLHFGPDSEASAGQCLVKIAAVRQGQGAAGRFADLLEAIDSAAESLGATRIAGGTNTGRIEAYRMMKAAGYRTDVNGIAMFRPASEGYNRSGIFVIDDWR